MLPAWPGHCRMCLSVSVCLSVCMCLEVRYPAGAEALVRPAWLGHCPMCLSLCLSVCLSLCVSVSVYLSVSLCVSVCVSRNEVSSWSSGTGAACVVGLLSYVSVCVSVCVCLCVCLSVCLCLEVRYPAGVQALVRPAWSGRCPMCLSVCLLSLIHI